MGGYALVKQTAAIMNMSEFDLFVVAYLSEYPGAVGGNAEIEYRRFIETQELPPWVESYCTAVGGNHA